MSMTAMKAEAAAQLVTTTAAPVVTMTPRRAPASEKYIKVAKETAVRVIPPLIGAGGAGSPAAQGAGAAGRGGVI